MDTTNKSSDVQERGRLGAPLAEPLWLLIGRPMAVVAGIVVLAAWMLRDRPVSSPIPEPPPVVLPESRVVESPAPEPERPAEPEEIVVVGPPIPVVDDDQVQSAEAARTEAARQLDEAVAREQELARSFEAAKAELKNLVETSHGIEVDFEVPESRIRQIAVSVEELENRKERLVQVVTQLEGQPPPRRPLLSDAKSTKSPVAREVDGEEFHFEIRGDRVAFVDLERLLELAEKDARLRIRMTQSSRPFVATVGPVGAFSMKYELGPSPLGGLNDLLGSGGVTSFTLLGFEVVPNQRLRGETLEVALRPASEFGRVINRLNPARTTITLWVYPDGFQLFRQLRELLSQHGFFVAARPLPDDIPIRGSPTGSRSAAQ